MAGTVSTTQLLDITTRVDERGEKLPFSLRWVTLDTTRKDKPSKHKYLARAVSCGSRLNLVRHGMIAVKPVDGGHPIHIYLDLVEEVNGMLHT